MTLQAIKRQLDALKQEKQTDEPPVKEMFIYVVDSETGKEQLLVEQWTLWPEQRLIWKEADQVVDDFLQKCRTLPA